MRPYVYWDKEKVVKKIKLSNCNDFRNVVRDYEMWFECVWGNGDVHKCFGSVVGVYSGCSECLSSESAGYHLGEVYGSAGCFGGACSVFEYIWVCFGCAFGMFAFVR